MHALTTFHPGSSFLRFGAWSVLLHISAVAMIGVLHVTRPADSALSRVTVTLLESPTPVSNNAPPVAPQQVPPSPRLLRLPPQHSTTAPDIPQPPTRHAVPQEQQTAGIGKPNATTVWTSHEVSTPAFSTTHPYAPDAPKTFRDATADRKGLRTPVRPIKSDRPPYPYTARERDGKAPSCCDSPSLVRERWNRPPFTPVPDSPSLTRAPFRQYKRGDLNRRKTGNFPFPRRWSCRSNSPLVIRNTRGTA